MQTTVVDYVFEQLEENSLFFRGTDNELNISISASDYLDLKRLAKAIFEKQIIEAFDEGQEYEYQYHINNAPKFYSETYFAETYGSKGSDETNGNNVEEVPNVSNATEIKNYFMRPFETQEKWREILK